MTQSGKKHLAAAELPQRDENRELVWLGLAELDAGESGFADHAHRRLAVGEQIYGDQWARRTLGELVDELSEEAADLGSWGVLALQALEHVDIGAAQRDLIATSLQAAMLWGAYAHRALAIARGHLDARPPDDHHA